MTLGNLIKEKDYDYIEFRMIHPKDKEKTVFYGSAKSVDGSLISLDGDDYQEELEKELISYNEWSNETKNIESGLTVVFDFYSEVETPNRM